MASFEQLFQEFSSHIIPSWFLTNTKQELQKCCSSRATTLFITSDFAENVVVVRKYEVSDQYFHRVEILLWGAVASYVVTESNEELVLRQESYMVSSDYRCTIGFSFDTPILHRAKDNQLVYVALRKCLQAVIESAARFGVVFRNIIHKVKDYSRPPQLTLFYLIQFSISFREH